MATLRVARPTDRLEEVVHFYLAALGFERLASFRDHDGYDGEIVGFPGAPWHLEFVTDRRRAAGDAPTEEHLLALYFADPRAYEAALARAADAGQRPVPAHNPYWDRLGRTFADPDGYRVVLVKGTWPRRS